MRTPPNMIAEEAANWVARIDRDGDTAQLRAEISAWAADDDRRAGALLRAEATWALLNRAAVLGGAHGDGLTLGAEEVGHPLHPTIDMAERSLKKRKIWGGAAAAAAFALVLTPLMMREPVQHIETALGEIRRVPLADGSLAAVNTDTKMEVALKAEERHVVLERGEAWFEVAKDPSRPFVVEADDVRIRAIGTAFSVQKHEGAVDVRVTEGVVDVWRVGDEGSKRRISAGAQLSLGEQGPAAILASVEPIERALSWRDGQLIFDGDTVADAAEKFNRYNIVKIEIIDDDLRHQKMIGRFRTNEPQAFARAAAALLNAKVDVREDKIVISSY